MRDRKEHGPFPLQSSLFMAPTNGSGNTGNPENLPNEHSSVKFERLGVASGCGTQVEKGAMRILTGTHELVQSRELAVAVSCLTNQIKPHIMWTKRKSVDVSKVYAPFLSSMSMPAPVETLLAAVDESLKTNFLAKMEGRLENGYVREEWENDPESQHELVLRRYILESALALNGISTNRQQLLTSLGVSGDVRLIPDFRMTSGGTYAFQFDAITIENHKNGLLTEILNNLDQQGFWQDEGNLEDWSDVEVKMMYSPRYATGEGISRPRSDHVRDTVHRIGDLASEAKMHGFDFSFPENVHFVYPRGVMPTVIHTLHLDSSFFYAWYGVLDERKSEILGSPRYTEMEQKRYEWLMEAIIERYDELDGVNEARISRYTGAQKN